MYRTWLQIILLAIIPFFSLAQNCDFSIDAGSDMVICESGMVSLNASTSAIPLSVTWSPQGLFSDPTDLSTTANILNTTTLSLSVEILSEVNLVVNGDFSQGDTGFSSDYIYGTGGGVGLLSNEGQYAIADNAGDTHNHFDDCADHTGGGNMMVVNASGLPNNIWCQTITVAPGTDYDFSAWITSVTDENPAQLQFSINGSLIGDIFNASATTCSWDQFAAQWNSGIATTATICIVNSNLTPNGNDFAMDDISFRQICVLTDEVTVEVTTLYATWINPGLFCETDAPVNLNNWLSNIATTGGSWTINQISAVEFDPGSLGSGLHEVIYTVQATDCSESFSWTLGVAPYLEAGQAESMNVCQNENQNILLSDLLLGESPGGLWVEVSDSPSSGNAFNPNAGTFNTLGQPAGTYLFEYSHENIAPCPSSSATVTVTINPLPTAFAGPDQSLDCFNETVTLGASITNPELVFTWLAADGSVLGDGTSVLSVSNEGVYSLNVINAVTGCFATDEVTVSSNIADISLTASTTPISCNQTDDGAITIQSVSGGTGPYLFSIDGENFTSALAFPGLEAGNYTLTAIDAFGCETMLTLVLEPSSQLSAVLTASIPGDPVLISLGDSLTLSVLTNVVPEKIDTIIWDPFISQCTGCLEIVINPVTTTTYSVTISDDNGCTASDELTVVVEKEDDVYIPNAFSPNDDGINDLFYIHTAKGAVKVIEFIIVDRWGGLVFQNKDFPPNAPDGGWNGRHKGQLLNAGVYIYSVQIEMADGSVVKKMGEITLIY